MNGQTKLQLAKTQSERREQIRFLAHTARFEKEKDREKKADAQHTTDCCKFI